MCYLVKCRDTYTHSLFAFLADFSRSISPDCAWGIGFEKSSDVLATVVKLLRERYKIESYQDFLDEVGEGTLDQIGSTLAVEIDCDCAQIALFETEKKCKQ